MIFRKSLKNIQFSLKSDKMTGTSHENLYIFMIISRQILLKMRSVSPHILEKIKTHIICSITFLPKIVPFVRQKFVRTGQAQNDNTVHALCMLD